MTLQEAIERLEGILHCARTAELRSYLDPDDCEALEIAIAALEVDMED